MAETASELGLALGVAIGGSVATAVYRNNVTVESLPAGLAPDVSDAARDTLGSAVNEAAQLDDGLASGLLDTTRDAFTQGLTTASFVNAGVVLVASVLVAAILWRRTPPTGSSAGGSPSPGAGDELTAQH